MYKRNPKPNILLIGKHIDFRCGINSMVMTLAFEYNLKATDNTLFVFINKKKNALKMIYWGGAGYYLILYRLSVAKFKWFKNKSIKDITYEQMEWLLNGKDIDQDEIQEVDVDDLV